jgi:hypothetical protein
MKGKFLSNYEGPIVGPILPHLHSVGMDGPQIVLATAYFSRRALLSVRTLASKVRVFCRLDIQSADEWVNGYVDPPALLEFAQNQKKRGATIEMFISPFAHAKVYIGSHAALVGSANLTLRGFGGGQEIIYRIKNPGIRKQLLGIVDIYSKDFDRISLKELDEYIDRFKSIVSSHPKRRFEEDRLPRFRRSRHIHLGDYADFLKWLERKKSYGSEEILERARGKHNLSGHIHRNFYGIRQFLLAFPEELSRLTRENENSYTLSKDMEAKKQFKDFVLQHASNEPDFSLDTWRTYLPLGCGGKARSGGATIGNLNYMIPLIARYLYGRVNK